jgi:transposase
VRAAVASDRPPKYERPRKGSVTDAAEPRIRELLKAYPTMPATVIAERIGWEHSVRVLRDRVAELRPAYLPPDPASRTAYAAGEIAQCDFWFPPVTIPAGCGQVRKPVQLPVLTMVCAYSRWLTAVLTPTRTAADLFAGWWQLITGVGAVPRVLVWDGEGAIGRWRAGRAELTGDCQAFRGTPGAKVVVCKPADPEAKGIIERCRDYLERSFLPGRAFASPADFNAQLAGWLALVNTRPRRALGCSPAERIGADKAAMLTVPPVAPVTGRRASARLARDRPVAPLRRRHRTHRPQPQRTAPQDPRLHDTIRRARRARCAHRLNAPRRAARAGARPCRVRCAGSRGADARMRSAPGRR